MKLNGIIFDLDGTLGDTLPVCFKAFRHAILEYTGRSLTDQQIRATFGPSEEGIIRSQVPERWQECLELYVEAYRRDHAIAPDPFPGRALSPPIFRSRRWGSDRISISSREVRPQVM